MNNQIKNAWLVVAVLITGRVLYSVINHASPWCDKHCQRLNRIREYKQQEYLIIEECIMRGNSRRICEVNREATRTQR